ncbi:sulfatase family protein [Roseibacillus ishigakijimensis]|uniref:Arylsulfatase n=1 Tax=Roseibacillus ishigakijimensis TaxID=454146 RepID=A0A934RJN3_9BACT|nr:arylsulfatase [Roseibacillus ishigakijimensis]MBK1832649.1 arylsulfatase [Roseibacillus ishigakijimensis]
MRSSHLLIPVLSALLFAGETVAQSPVEKPNVLVLYADDLGYGDLGCYHEGSKIPTPHLDQLAREGMRFTDGHSSSGICTPSRYALLTGRYHWRDFHSIVNAMGSSVFAPERLTWPEMMQEAGYETACIGKWHLGWDWEAIRKEGVEGQAHEIYDWSQPVPDGPLAHGFDSYFGDTVINFPPYAWIRDDRLVEAPDTTLSKNGVAQKTKEGNWETRPGAARSDWDFYDVLPALTREGERYLAEKKKQKTPFFLYFSFPSPHAPIIPTDEFDGRSQAGAYGDFVVQTDEVVGRLLAALKESGHYDNTVIIFTADNGPEHYAYARDKNHQHWSAEPLRGLKRDIYEGGHRVPFLIKWPGRTAPHSVSEALISQIDLMATFAAHLNVELPPRSAEDSHNLLPVLAGEEDKGRASHIHNTYPDRYAIRIGDWVYLDVPSGHQQPRRAQAWEKSRHYPQDELEVELFNLREDLPQKNNLADRYPEKVAEMKAALKEERERGFTAPRLLESKS